MKREATKFDTEADLCAAFIAEASRDKRWTFYPETAGWDILAGGGTTAIVAKECGFDATLIEADPTFQGVITERIAADAPLFAEVTP